jgi:hypothetical protein
MVAIFSNSDDPWVLVQSKGEIGLASKPGTFENNLWTTFNNHIGLPKDALRPPKFRTRIEGGLPAQSFFVLSEPR